MTTPSSAVTVSDERIKAIAIIPSRADDAEISEMAGELYALRSALSTAVLVPKSAIDWLDGAAPDANGKWFGDDVPERKPYWWRRRFREMIATELAALRAPATEWQGMESAPKDGTWIEAWRPPLPGNDGVWWKSKLEIRWHLCPDEDGTWVWPDSEYDAITRPDHANDLIEKGDCYEALDGFTHWRHLPTTPKGADE